MRVGLGLALPGRPGTLAAISVSPAFAVDTGGSSLTITGSGFEPGAKVKIGGVAATSVVVVSPTSITCLAPTGTGGNTADVVVTESDGETVTGAAEVTFYSLPTSVAGLTGWWADAISTNGGGVTQWTDLSGNGRHFANIATPQPVAKSITAAVSAGGLIKITTSGNHLLSHGDTVTITGVVGTTEANATWVISWVSNTQFTLNGSTFVHAYVSGGTVTSQMTRQPAKSVAALNGHDVLDFSPTNPGGTLSTLNGPKALSSKAAFHTPDLISASTYYWYWLVNIVDNYTNNTPGQFVNQAIWSDAPPGFEAGLMLRSTPTAGVYNYGGNADATNGEYANAGITFGTWVVITARHLAGKIGIRIGSGAFTETTSVDTQFAFGADSAQIGCDQAIQLGAHMLLATSAVFNAAPSAQQDLAILAYLRQYGALP